MANKEVTKKRKKKKSKSLTVLTVLLVILAVLIALAAFILTWSKPEDEVEIDFDKNVEETDEAEETLAPDVPTIDEDKVNQTIAPEDNKEEEVTRDDGWTHYLLLGVDGEKDSYESKRSDAMIVLSVSKREGRVVLSSIPRDTLVYIDGKGFDKLTHAYAYGGAALTVKTYEDNFDIDIENYITINFAAMRDVVDLLGGLTLTLTNAEAKHMGEYYAAWGLSGGTQVLNGKEVLAYCRVRKIDSDFKRTERQYNVLMAIYNEVKHMSLSEYTELIGIAYKHVNTDMIVADMIGLATTMLGIIDEGEIEHLGLVNSQYCKIGNLNGKSVVLVDNLVDTAKRWREAMGIENYEPSSRLQQISKQLDALR